MKRSARVQTCPLTLLHYRRRQRHWALCAWKRHGKPTRDISMEFGGVASCRRKPPLRRPSSLRVTVYRFQTAQNYKGPDASMQVPVTRRGFFVARRNAAQDGRRATVSFSQSLRHGSCTPITRCAAFGQLGRDPQRSQACSFLWPSDEWPWAADQRTTLPLICGSTLFVGAVRQRYEPSAMTNSSVRAARVGGFVRSQLRLDFGPCFFGAPGGGGIGR